MNTTLENTQSLAVSELAADELEQVNGGIFWVPIFWGAAKAGAKAFGIGFAGGVGASVGASFANFFFNFWRNSGGGDTLGSMRHKR